MDVKPICLLSILRKVYQRMCNARLETEIEKRIPLSSSTSYLLEAKVDLQGDARY